MRAVLVWDYPYAKRWPRNKAAEYVLRAKSAMEVTLVLPYINKCMKNKNRSIVLVLYMLFTLLSISGIAQNRTISGRVTNGITSKPIEGVQISVQGSDANTTSNADGEYSLKIPDTLKTVTFTDFEGMDVMEVKQISDDEINIYLLESNMADLTFDQLMNIIVVTAGKQEQQISDIPASVVVITRADIEAYGYQSLKEILSNVLGMYMIDEYRTVSFGVRGFFSNVPNRNIIFLINGVTQKQPFQEWNDLYTMNIQMENIERIEIVRGPTAILYGNDAFFGAINIITHEKGQPTTSSAATAYGTDNTYRGNMQIVSSTPNTSFDFSAGYYHTDGRDIPFKPILDSVQRYDKVWIKDGTTKDFFNQDSKYFNTSINYHGFYTNISYDVTERNVINAFKPVYDTLKISRNENFLRFKIGYTKEISTKLSVDIHINLENYNAEGSYAKALVTPNIDKGILKNSCKKMSYELLIINRPIKRLEITYGALNNIYRTGQSYTDVPQVGYNRNLDEIISPRIEYAVYTNVDYKLTQVLTANAGIRADKQNPYDFRSSKFVGNVYEDTTYTYNDDDIAFAKSLSLIYKINNKNILKTMYNSANSRPGISENIYFLGEYHPMLVPQTIASTELNYITTELKKTTISFSAFYNHLDKLINRRVYSDAEGKYINTNDNSGKLETVGGEFQLTYKPISELSIDASFMYQKTTNKVFNNTAAFSPNTLAYFKAFYVIKKDIVIGANTYYVGSMQSDWDEIKMQRIHKTTPNYFNLGINLRFNKLFKTELFFSIHANNLLNADIYYAPSYTNNSFLPNGTYDNGIQWSATAGLKF